MSTGNPQFDPQNLPSNSREFILAERKEKWKQKRAEIDGTEADAKGKGIDEGVKDAATAFNLNGLPTSASCEGHPEVSGEHRPWPWIRISLDEPQERYVGETEAFESAAKKHSVSVEELRRGYPEELYWEVRKQVSQNPVTDDYQEWEKWNEKLHKRATQLVAEFNKNREVEEDVRLKIEDSDGGSFEVSSEAMLVVDFLVNKFTEEERRRLLELLPRRQKEMRNFIEFLKARFLAGKVVKEALPRRKIVEYYSDEEEFYNYVADLQLSSEDLSKKILDVGSGSSQFAKWGSESGINLNIFSLEPMTEPRERTRSVQGKVEAIPFSGGAFDLVISNCAIPNVFLGEKSVKENVRTSLLEMIRVTKPGGEIRLGKVLIKYEYKSQRELVLAIEEVLDELKRDYGITTEEIRAEDISNAYLIKIHKPLKTEDIKS